MDQIVARMKEDSQLGYHTEIPIRSPVTRKIRQSHPQYGTFRVNDSSVAALLEESDIIFKGIRNIRSEFNGKPFAHLCFSSLRSALLILTL